MAWSTQISFKRKRTASSKEGKARRAQRFFHLFPPAVNLSARVTIFVLLCAYECGAMVLAESGWEFIVDQCLPAFWDHRCDDFGLLRSCIVCTVDPVYSCMPIDESPRIDSSYSWLCKLTQILRKCVHLQMEAKTHYLSLFYWVQFLCRVSNTHSLEILSTLHPVWKARLCLARFSAQSTVPA